MSKSFRAGVALAGLTALVAQADKPSLCTQLAEHARKSAPDTWALRDPLAAWVQRAAPAATSPVVTALRSDTRWRSLVGDADAEPLAVQQLDGAPVYLLDAVAGTAHCQSFVVVQAVPGQPAKRLEPPFNLDDTMLCMTQSASFARVLGQPAFVVGGAASMTSPDISYRIARWDGSGWAQRCRITVRRQTGMSEAQRFCPPGSTVCGAAHPMAQRLAQAYEASRRSGKALDAQAFHGGQTVDPVAAAALNPPLAEPDAVGDMNPPFPLFGAADQRLDPMLTVFSNADPRRLAVLVDGRWWLAVVGRSGVGWREGDAVLVALFAPPGRASDGVASYQFRVRFTGLRSVTAADDSPGPAMQKAR